MKLSDNTITTIYLFKSIKIQKFDQVVLQICYLYCKINYFCFYFKEYKDSQLTKEQ